MVRFDMYVLDYVSWFLVGSVSTALRLNVTSKYFTIFMLHSIITSRSLFLNTFCRYFLIFCICGPLQFLKIDSPSSLYKPMFFVSCCHPNKFNNKYLIVHTSPRHRRRSLKHQTGHFLFSSTFLVV